MSKLFSEEFQKNGYVTIPNILDDSEIAYFRNIYEDFLSGKISTSGHRSDLSGSDGKKELIVQIMRPSILHPPLSNSVLHQKIAKIAKELLGSDMELDFDMLIDKPPFTNKETPFHQDEAYWIDMDDKRAVSCWLALDDVSKENGCMWYVPQSHKEEIRPHVQTGNGGALMCEASEDEAKAVEMKAGSCTFHDGRTIHFARGNSTGNRRRAFILNFRPKAMIEFERANGFDHLGERKER
jgi:ectoine hydroxylase-related dioxygenase (phytanoyl-CoA dioxygenase family)